MNKHLHIIKIVGIDLLLIEFGPVAVFVVAYYLSTFAVAALSLAIATFCALVVSRIVNKRLPWFALFSGVITIITSFVTYYYDSPTVLIVKDSIYYVFFGLLLLASLRSGKLIFETFFGHIFSMEHKGWEVLQRRWMGMFFIAGFLNEIVRMSLTVGEWIIYKQVILVAFVIFGFWQFRVTMKYKDEGADRWGLKRLPGAKR